MIPASSARATTPTAHCFDMDSVNPYPIPELECDTTRIAEVREWLNFDTPENNEWLRKRYGDAPIAMRQSESDDVSAIYGPWKCKHDAISTMCRGRPGAVIDTMVRKSEKRNLRVRTFTTEEVAAIIASGSVLDDEDGLVWALPFYEEVVTADPDNRWHYWLAVYVHSQKTVYIFDSQTKQPRRTQNIRNLLTVLSNVRNEHFNILEVDVRHTQIQVARELSESMLFVCRWIQELQQSDWRSILDSQFDHESLFIGFKDDSEKRKYYLWREDTVGRAWTEEGWESEIDSPTPSSRNSPDLYDGRTLSLLDIQSYRDWLNRQVIMQNPQNVSPTAVRELSVYVDKYLCGIEQHIELSYGRWAFNNGAVGLLLHVLDKGPASAGAAGAINVTPLYPGSNVILCDTASKMMIIVAADGRTYAQPLPQLKPDTTLAGVNGHHFTGLLSTVLAGPLPAISIIQIGSQGWIWIARNEMVCTGRQISWKPPSRQEQQLRDLLQYLKAHVTPYDTDGNELISRISDFIDCDSRDLDKLCRQISGLSQPGEMSHNPPANAQEVLAMDDLLALQQRGPITHRRPARPPGQRLLGGSVDEEGGSELSVWGPSPWHRSQPIKNAASEIERQLPPAVEKAFRRIFPGDEATATPAHSTPLDIDLLKMLKPSLGENFDDEAAFAWESHYLVPESMNKSSRSQSMIPANDFMDSGATEWIHNKFISPLTEQGAKNDSYLLGHFQDTNERLLDNMRAPTLEQFKVCSLAKHMNELKAHRYWIIPMHDVNTSLALDTSDVLFRLRVRNELSPALRVKGTLKDYLYALKPWLDGINLLHENREAFAYMPEFDELSRNAAPHDSTILRTDFVKFTTTISGIGSLYEPFRRRAELVSTKKNQHGPLVVEIKFDKPEHADQIEGFAREDYEKYSSPPPRTGAVGGHWWVTIYDTVTGQLYIHDSATDSKIKRRTQQALERNLMWFVRTYNVGTPPRRETFGVFVDCPQQRNIWSCGYYSWLNILVFMIQGLHKQLESHHDSRSRAAARIIRGTENDGTLGERFHRVLIGHSRKQENGKLNAVGEHREIYTMEQEALRVLELLTSSTPGHAELLKYARQLLQQAGAILFTFSQPDCRSQCQSTTRVKCEGYEMPSCEHGFHIIPVPQDTKVILLEEPVSNNSINSLQAAIYPGMDSKQLLGHSEWVDDSSGVLKFLVGNAGQDGAFVRSNGAALKPTFEKLHEMFGTTRMSVNGYAFNCQKGKYTVRLPNHAWIVIGEAVWAWIKRDDINIPNALKKQITHRIESSKIEEPDRNGTGLGVLSFLEQEGLLQESREYSKAIKASMFRMLEGFGYSDIQKQNPVPAVNDMENKFNGDLPVISVWREAINSSTSRKRIIPPARKRLPSSTPAGGRKILTPRSRIRAPGSQNRTLNASISSTDPSRNGVPPRSMAPMPTAAPSLPSNDISSSNDAPKSDTTQQNGTARPPPSNEEPPQLLPTTTATSAPISAPTAWVLDVAPKKRKASEISITGQQIDPRSVPNPTVAAQKPVPVRVRCQTSDTPVVVERKRTSSISENATGGHNKEPSPNITEIQSDDQQPQQKNNQSYIQVPASSPLFSQSFSQGSSFVPQWARPQAPHSLGAAGVLPQVDSSVPPHGRSQGLTRTFPQNRSQEQSQEQQQRPQQLQQTHSQQEPEFNSQHQSTQKGTQPNPHRATHMAPSASNSSAPQAPVVPFNYDLPAAITSDPTALSQSAQQLISNARSRASKYTTKKRKSRGQKSANPPNYDPLDSDDSIDHVAEQYQPSGFRPRRRLLKDPDFIGPADQCPTIWEYSSDDDGVSGDRREARKARARKQENYDAVTGRDGNIAKAVLPDADVIGSRDPTELFRDKLEENEKELAQALDKIKELERQNTELQTENGQLRDSGIESNENADDRQRMEAEYADKLSELEKRNKALEQENARFRNTHNSSTNTDGSKRTKVVNEGLLSNTSTTDPISKNHQDLSRQNEELIREKNDLTRDNEELTLSLGQALAEIDEQEQKNKFYQKQIKELMNSMDHLLGANNELKKDLDNKDNNAQLVAIKDNRIEALEKRIKGLRSDNFKLKQMLLDPSLCGTGAPDSEVTHGTQNNASVKLQEDHRHLQEQYTFVHAENNKLRADLDALKLRFNTNAANSGSLEQSDLVETVITYQIKKYETMIEALEERLADRESQLRQLQEACETQSSTQPSNSQGIQQNQDNLTNEIDDLKQKIQDQQKEASEEKRNRDTRIQHLENELEVSNKQHRELELNLTQQLQEAENERTKDKKSKDDRIQYLEETVEVFRKQNLILEDKLRKERQDAEEELMDEKKIKEDCIKQLEQALKESEQRLRDLEEKLKTELQAAEENCKDEKRRKDKHVQRLKEILEAVEKRLRELEGGETELTRLAAKETQSSPSADQDPDTSSSDNDSLHTAVDTQEERPVTIANLRDEITRLQAQLGQYEHFELEWKAAQKEVDELQKELEKSDDQQTRLEKEAIELEKEIMSYKFRYESELTEHSKAGQVIAQQHADLSSLRERLQLAEADLQQSEQALQETQEKLKNIEGRLVAEQQKRLELQQKADLAIEAHMGSSQLEREAREAQERRAQEAAEEAERVRQEERDQRERIQREAEAEKERIAREAQEERERIARETQEERERIAKEAQAEREERERREQEAQEERARREQEMEVAKKQTQAEKEQAEALLKKRCQKAVRDEIARLVLVHRQALREDALDAAMSVEARDRAKSEGRSHCSICGKQTNVKTVLDHLIGGKSQCNIPGYDYLISKETARLHGYDVGKKNRYVPPEGTVRELSLPPIPSEELQQIRRQIRASELWDPCLNGTEDENWDIEDADWDSEGEEEEQQDPGSWETEGPKSLIVMLKVPQPHLKQLEQQGSVSIIADGVEQQEQDTQAPEDSSQAPANPPSHPASEQAPGTPQGPTTSEATGQADGTNAPTSVPPANPDPNPVTPHPNPRKRKGDFTEEDDDDDESPSKKQTTPRRSARKRKPTERFY